MPGRLREVHFSCRATNAEKLLAAYRQPEADIMSTHTDTMGPATADAVTAPLDLLLTDAALGALRRMNPGDSGLRLAAALAARPRLVARQGRQLLGEMARIAAGTSAVRTSQRDRRFTDPGWEGNPLLRRVLQAYLAAAQAAESCRGSWWPDYAGWLAERCGEETAAPEQPGGGGLVPLCDAPGMYAHDL